MEGFEKEYVPVTVYFDHDGIMHPRAIEWGEDGTQYKISRVKDIRPAASMKVGGGGDRYTVVINGHETYLFFERATDTSGHNPVIGRWFVERKKV